MQAHAYECAMKIKNKEIRNNYLLKLYLVEGKSLKNHQLKLPNEKLMKMETGILH